MGRHDFEVDLQAMAGAAKGIAETVKLFQDKDVGDLVPSAAQVGDETLWAAVDEFQDRWERGTKNMVEDAEEAGGRLGKVVMNYLEYEQSGKETFAGVKGEIAGLRLFGLT